MLRDDDGEERPLDGIRFALQHPEFVVATIRIVRREHDEPLLRQPGGEGLVVTERLAVLIRRDDIGRHSFQPVLADDDRPAFAGLEILRQQQIAPGKNIGKDVEHDFKSLDPARQGVGSRIERA